MRDGSTRPVACPTCGGTGISAPYRTDAVLYLACDQCAAVWPVDVAASKSALDYLPERLKTQHSYYLDDHDDS